MKAISFFALSLALIIYSNCLQRNSDYLFKIGNAIDPIQIYFSRPESDSTDIEKQSAENAVLEIIENSSVSLEIWCYGFSSLSLIEALKRARERGVQIYITGSREQKYTLLENSGFSISRRTKTGLQHAKIIIADGKYIFTGTGNFTKSGFFHNHNAFIKIVSEQQKTALLSEMMQNETLPHPVIKNILPGVQVYSSPRGGKLIQNSILKAIHSAKYRIRYLIFSHTDPVITAALYKKIREGVIVEGIYDNPYDSLEPTPGSQAAALNNSMHLYPGAIYFENNRNEYKDSSGNYHGGHLHHKTLIVDERVVLTGSYNWSLSARDSNQEIFFIINNPFITADFVREYEKIRENSTLLSRASFPKSDPNPGEPKLAYNSNEEICWTGDVQSYGFAIFSGKGPYFRTQYYKPINSIINNCISLFENEKISSGISGSSTHLLPPLHFNANISNFELNLNYVENFSDTHSENFPCKQKSENCSSLKIFRFNPSQGWIWLHESSEDISQFSFLSLQLWDRTGMNSAFPLSKISDTFYTFVPIEYSPGDSILFLKNSEGQNRAGCAYAGAQFTGIPSFFVDELFYEFGMELECVAIES